MQSNTDGLGQDIGPKVFFVFGHGAEELDQPRIILEEDCKLVVKAECGVDTVSEADDLDITYHVLQIQPAEVLLDPFYAPNASPFKELKLSIRKTGDPYPDFTYSLFNIHNSKNHIYIEYSGVIPLKNIKKYPDCSITTRIGNIEFDGNRYACDIDNIRGIIRESFKYSIPEIRGWVQEITSGNFIKREYIRHAGHIKDSSVIFKEYPTIFNEVSNLNNNLTGENKEIYNSLGIYSLDNYMAYMFLCHLTDYVFSIRQSELFRITNGGTYYNIVCRSISTNLPGIDLIVKQKHRNIMKNISSKLKKESDPLKRAQLEILAKVIETRRRGSINYRLGNKGGSRKTCYIRQKKNCKTKRVRRR